MKNVNWKELFIDILVDIVAGMIIAVGIYNFALNADLFCGDRRPRFPRFPRFFRFLSFGGANGVMQ